MPKFSGAEKVQGVKNLLKKAPGLGGASGAGAGLVSRLTRVGEAVG
ncbi:hypothetical protein THIAE_09020 [Thiomicrospira aerophila AL3]|uniref:Uncharacterized protein n=1 Tax=Thiomicrospira aerophila AL3 TaxID=717772 RepID=W0DYM5_9GAMM|nr:hypothetical protein THIAE_09020 [Thiomicrospira aerophila AL3]